MRTSRLIALASLLLLGGCSSDRSSWGEYLQILRQGLTNSFGDKAIKRDQAAAIPYASLGYRINGGREALLVLATDNGGEQLWTSASHVVLLTSGGRILRSTGLPNDLSGTVGRDGSALPPLSNALRGPYQSNRLIDLSDIGRYGVALNCITTMRGRQTISILGTAIATTRIDETCRATQPRWSFTDKYWIDAETGFVWHSIQNLHPAGTIIQTEIFRPPG